MHWCSVQLARRVLQLERSNTALNKELDGQKQRVKQLADEVSCWHFHSRWHQFVLCYFNNGQKLPNWIWCLLDRKCLCGKVTKEWFADLGRCCTLSLFFFYNQTWKLDTCCHCVFLQLNLKLGHANTLWVTSVHVQLCSQFSCGLMIDVLIIDFENVCQLMMLWCDISWRMPTTC